MNRRNFLLGAAVTLVAAPAIVRVASIMPVKTVELAEAVSVRGFTVIGYDDYLDPISEFIPYNGWGQKSFSVVTHVAFDGAPDERAVQLQLSKVARAC